VIGQKYNRPANERRRRLHSGCDKVSYGEHELFSVVLWPDSLYVVVDKTLRVVLQNTLFLRVLPSLRMPVFVSNLSHTNTIRIYKKVSSAVAVIADCTAYDVRYSYRSLSQPCSA